MPKKKFIDRKNAVTFHLVHRSQQDPLTADENAPKHVLLPVEAKVKDTKDASKRKEEQQKYGVFFDDDYNYLQHLRDTSQTVVWERVEPPTPKGVPEPKIQLPSSVFASVVEEDVGLLNKAAPQSGLRLDLDPELVAAMDEDFDFEDPDNELEDNFMELANAEGETEEEQYDSEEEASDVDSLVGDTDEECDSVGSLEHRFMEEETKSRFTEYSMTSSVMRRNQQLTLLDDRFEQMYTKCYDENDIGALDCEEIEGSVEPNSELLMQCAAQFEKDQKREHLEQEAANTAMLATLQESSSDEEPELVPLQIPQEHKWDCESILSTYSNIYNHPKLISEPKKATQKIKINMRTGMPEDVLGRGRLTAAALSQLEGGTGTKGPASEGGKSLVSLLSVLSVRPVEETPEERSARKRQLREYRRQRRADKKLNTLAFKEETKRQNKIAINNRNNVQGNRIL